MIFSSEPLARTAGAGRVTARRRLQPWHFAFRLFAVLAVALALVAGGNINLGVTPVAHAAENCNKNFGFSLSGPNEKIVSAELGWSGSRNGALRARADEWGPWEKFTLCINDAYATLKSNANGKYVSVEMNAAEPYKYMLRARATKVGPWEKFTKKNLGNGWQYYLISQANGRYVSVEKGYRGELNGLLRARAQAAGPWELFGA